MRDSSRTTVTPGSKPSQFAHAYFCIVTPGMNQSIFHRSASPMTFPSDGKLDIHATSTLRASRRQRVRGQDFATAGVRHSETLRLIDGKVSCAKCGDAISIKGESWKSAAKLTELNIANMPGAPSSIDKGWSFANSRVRSARASWTRRIALPNDPFLEDSLFG
jgi:hypothetical protein